MSRHDVIIVGAGLAGLRAAALLDDGATDVLLLDGADRVGGRCATDRVDGYVVDRGFQLLNPSYPALRATGVLEELDLRPLSPSVVVRQDGRDRAIGDPRRAPFDALRGLRAGLVRPLDAVALARGVGRAVTGSRPRFQGADTTTSEGLTALGLSSSLRDDVLAAFLRGVTLDQDLSTSWQYAQLVLRSLVRGVPCTPYGGIEALPLALRRQLSSVTLRLGEAATSVSPTRVTTTLGSYDARVVILASDGSAAAHLGYGDEPNWLGVTTSWWSVPALSDGRLRLDRDGGRLVNAVALSVAAPEHAPARRGLIAASSLDLEVSETDVRDDVARLFGFGRADVTLVTHSVVPRALPSLRRLGDRPAAATDDILLAGDYRATPSIQGALASGAAAAREARRRL